MGGEKKERRGEKEREGRIKNRGRRERGDELKKFEVVGGKRERRDMKLGWYFCMRTT